MSAGGVKASGHLRVTAPAGLAAAMSRPGAALSGAAPEVTISLNLSDRVVDLAGEGFDCAVRVGDLPDSSLVSVRIADNRRLCVATPGYLQRRGTPQHPTELAQHDCLTLSSEASQTRGWAFRMPTEGGGAGWCTSSPAVRSTARTARCCTTGAWPAMASPGAAPGRSRRSRLRPAGGGAGGLCRAAQRYFVLFPQRKHLPLRVRLWIDHLRHHYEQPQFWKTGAPRMTLEALLAFFHLVAIATMVVFMASEAALCRTEWMNPAVVHRLVRLDLIYMIAAACVVLAGLARTWWGMKGGLVLEPAAAACRWLFAAMWLMSLWPTRAFLRWRRVLVTTRALPPEAEVRAARRWIMIETHLLGVLLLAAAFLARVWAPGAEGKPRQARPAGVWCGRCPYFLRHSLMKALRSSPFLPAASALQVFILLCWVCAASGLLLRQFFMKALRSSPFMPVASLLQVAILVCCLVGGLAGAFSSAAWALPMPVPSPVRPGKKLFHGDSRKMEGNPAKFHHTTGTATTGMTACVAASHGP